MKKLLSFLLCIAMILSFSGCGEEKTIGGIFIASTDESIRTALAEKAIVPDGTDSVLLCGNPQETVENAKLNGAGLLWSMSAETSDYIMGNSQNYPDILFSLYDYGSDALPGNVVTVDLREYEGTFLAGYVAGKYSSTGTVGFVGGEESVAASVFQTGFEKGVAYAAIESNREIVPEILYTGSSNDTALAKTAADTLYSAGCDVIFNAAGDGGDGIFESAVNCGLFVIGFGEDQSEKAPSNVITSVTEKTDSVVQFINNRYLSSELIGGKALSCGLKEDAFELSGGFCPPDILENASRVVEKIILHDIKII